MAGSYLLHIKRAKLKFLSYKLRDYREQANRDRFILPDDKDASYFSHTIDECIRFLA
jgi:hypothetical protein